MNTTTASRTAARRLHVRLTSGCSFAMYGGVALTNTVAYALDGQWTGIGFLVMATIFGLAAFKSFLGVVTGERVTLSGNIDRSDDE